MVRCQRHLHTNYTRTTHPAGLVRTKTSTLAPCHASSKWCGRANEWKHARCSPMGYHMACLHAVRRIALRRNRISLHSTGLGTLSSTRTRGADSPWLVTNPLLCRVLSKSCRLHFKMTALLDCGEGSWQTTCYGASRMTLRYHQLLREPLGQPRFEPRRGPGIPLTGLSVQV